MERLNILQDIKTDLWTNLKNSRKPIVLYGMGDGAEKILNVLEKKEIPVSAIFASDEFVRDKSFRGFKIMRLSQVEEKYEDFIILLSFATSIPELIEKITNLSKKHELYAPDVPVFGEGLFDMEFFIHNRERLEAVYKLLADDISKKTFESILKYKLTGKIEFLFECQTDISESYNDILALSDNESYVDIGAYNGDTIEQFLAYAGGYKNICAFEPDARNFRKLQKYIDEKGINAQLFNAAAWDKNEEISFFSRSGRNSAGTSVHKSAKEIKIQGCSVDSCAHFEPTYVKIDAEGSEQKVLCGLEKAIKSRAKLCVAAYHRNEDMFAIPESILSKNKTYKLYIRHFKYIPAWDTNFYFI